DASWAARRPSLLQSSWARRRSHPPPNRASAATRSLPRTFPHAASGEAPGSAARWVVPTEATVADGCSGRSLVIRKGRRLHPDRLRARGLVEIPRLPDRPGPRAGRPLPCPRLSRHGRARRPPARHATDSLLDVGTEYLEAYRSAIALAEQGELPPLGVHLLLGESALERSATRPVTSKKGERSPCRCCAGSRATRERRICTAEATHSRADPGASQGLDRRPVGDDHAGMPGGPRISMP